jgi:hypothetical protein
MGGPDFYKTKLAEFLHRLEILMSGPRPPAHGNRNQQNDLNAYRINAFTVTLPRDTCFQPFGEG